MTDSPSPALARAEQAEQAARANVYLDETMSTHADLDAYKAAILATVRAKVEALPGHGMVGQRAEGEWEFNGRFVPMKGAHWISRESVLSTLASGEGTR